MSDNEKLEGKETGRKVVDIREGRGARALQESIGAQEHVADLLGSMVGTNERQVSDANMAKADLENIFGKYGIGYDQKNLDYLASEEFKGILAISTFEKGLGTNDSNEPLRLGPTEGSDENRLTILEDVNLNQGFAINFLYYKPKENRFEVESVSICLNLEELGSIYEVKKAVLLAEKIGLDLKKAGFDIKEKLSNYLGGSFIDLEIKQDLTSADLDRLLGVLKDCK